MDDEICRNFLLVRTNLEYDSNIKNYKFNDDTHFKQYCDSNKCDTDLEKINAGCLYLLYTFFGSSDLFSKYANNYMNIIDYIMIWLGYMLNLKEQVGDKSNLQYFYKTYIDGTDKYKNSITYIKEYNNYKELIDKTNMINMDINDIFKFYDAFKLLCEMYTGFDNNKSNSTNCSEKANEFVEKYKDLNGDSNNTEGSVNCKDFPLLQEIKTSKNTAQSSKQNPEQTIQILEQISEVTSLSSSIGNKLIPFLSIFGTIAFFLGISYKYSLFKSRKRFRKQHLREKLKNKEETG
ncbi:Plasmodium variant antigen protein Cir/Yir/Bir, putative [Plasmodium berghei]|uniref:Plasmodium variant antigen protein Cir/Yir/Bir, putative n=1 Tax=Plasmodium berghei TaxID=5821 RepID=A0A1C6W9F6_PLABE|nr:Plasmodium variant antigen protein Cir/Yir/Bir, putative [Plasmodium berghei]SCL82884.1 Plasmodium variant antigen protein Cir/Yir/Bir, putative [Plasmodium berghei]SCL84128.1 Plasmodium variant antigen protein Cir/Yir/Bir, putative [Plasmodium berghei]